jgi:hypothetical protein
MAYIHQFSVSKCYIVLVEIPHLKNQKTRCLIILGCVGAEDKNFNPSQNEEEQSNLLMLLKRGNSERNYVCKETNN